MYARTFSMGCCRIRVPRTAIADYCRKHGIRRFSVFGSALRDDFTPSSDIDVLIEFEPGREVGLFGLAAMQRDLSELLDGRAVDLRTPEDLSRYFRDKVLAEAEVQYVGS
jgi:predicted nucleotidyltransferase